jgi:hypothetical protein
MANAAIPIPKSVRFISPLGADSTTAPARPGSGSGATVDCQWLVLFQPKLVCSFRIGFYIRGCKFPNPPICISRFEASIERFFPNLFGRHDSRLSDLRARTYVSGQSGPEAQAFPLAVTSVWGLPHETRASDSPELQARPSVSDHMRSSAFPSRACAN